ncbi:MAG: hypothetical protein AB2421_10970 [Thermotaleaceae bacterium]
MSVVDYSFFYQLGAAAIIGIVIKLLDSYLDDEIPSRMKDPALKYALLPYGLILFTIAVTLDISYAVTLFSASYILGMFFNFNRKLPSGLTGWQESLCILLINFLKFSFLPIFTSILAIFFIQCVDDLKDMNWDKKLGFHNLANQFGKIEIITVSIILFIVLTMYDFRKLVLIILCYFLIEKVYGKIN